MRRLLLIFLINLSSLYSFGQLKKVITSREYHVSAEGSNENEGSAVKPLKTISAAAQLAMPGDVITVHAGVYREQITPPRGGNSADERIVYQAAKGEKVEIKGSEIIKGWKKVGNDTWEVTIPNRFFGDFNPYEDLIRGDWFVPTPASRKYHTGAVYLNNSWLMEAAKKEEVTGVMNEKNPLWWGSVDSVNTTIWAQFKGVDPNVEQVEINVRQTVFYPERPFINFLTVRGFHMEHAATNWAPPTAEQMGLIGTHWSRGWIIEDNVVQYSKCVGIALGKYGDTWDNKDTESAIGYVGTINRALSFGWNKGTIGDHLVQNNTIAHCEQNGIVGSMGAAFSTIRGNRIHDIHIKRLFGGYEMAGIKLHGAVDVQIERNHIYRTNMGIWLDWMAQGAQVKGNLMHDNQSYDLFLEVNHGPMLVSNNIMLSRVSLLMNSRGAAFVHNMFGGNIEVIDYDSRLTPVQKPHATDVVELHDNPGGDIQFINNLFVGKGNVSQYGTALLPVKLDGNVYTKGTTMITSKKGSKRFGEMDKSAQETMKKYHEQPAEEQNATEEMDFDATPILSIQNGKAFLEIDLDKLWLKQKRKMVTSANLGKVIVPDLPYDNVDGSPIKIDTDYLGKKRNVSNPSPGPFEILKSGKQRIQVW